MQVFDADLEGNDRDVIADQDDNEVRLVSGWRKRVPELAARVDELCAPFDGDPIINNWPKDDGFADPRWVALVAELTAAGVVESSTLN
jgi:hypothetical protein